MKRILLEDSTHSDLAVIKASHKIKNFDEAVRVLIAEYTLSRAQHKKARIKKR